MGWIKRNLFFVIGGVVSLALLGGAGFFIWRGFSSNTEASNQLNELYDKLKEYASAPQKPGDDKIDNVKTAREQEKQVRDWITQAAKYFKPVAPIPGGAHVSGLDYSDALLHTIDQLQHEAENAGVALPPKYQFSFSAQCSRARFAAGSLEPLAQQLGEVKTISEILFAARVNNLDSIQRVRVSEDDEKGQQSDYLEEQSITNDFAVLTPYVLTFRSHTTELAKVMTGFATATNPFIIKSVAAAPAGTSSEAAAATPAAPVAQVFNPYARNPNYQPMVQQPQTPPKSGLQTVLKEKLLRITIEVEVVKLLPKALK